MDKTVIFDLGGVLIDWNPRYLYTEYFETTEAMEYFLENVCTMEWNEEQDGGRSLAEATALLTDAYPEYTTEIKAYYGSWETMLNGAIEDTVEIFKTIEKQSEKIYALTNWSAETFPLAKKHYPFLDLFTGILVSGQEKLKKPDPNIYHLILERYQLNPEECVFIDDNLRNIKAAEAVGIPSIHYTSAPTLKRQLETHNIFV